MNKYFKSLKEFITESFDSEELIRACKYNHYDKVKDLLFKGTEVNGIEGKNSPLHWVCLSGFKDIFLLLLEQDEIDVNYQNKDGDTPLHFAVLSEKNFIVSKLTEFPNIDVNIQNNKGFTPLHLAVKSNFIDIMDVLLGSKDLNIDVKDNENRNALRIALDENNQEAIRMLLSHKAKPDAETIQKYGDKFLSDF